MMRLHLKRILSRPALALATALSMLLTTISAVTPPLGQAAPPPPADGPGAPCPAGAPLRQFQIHAIQVDVVYNRYGQHNPSGVIYVLAENRDRVIAEVAANPGRTVRLVEPLTIRANLGDCVEIQFKNELNEHTSIHPTGVSIAVAGSDGMAVGHNHDSTVPPGGTYTYRWYPEAEGAFYFGDGANLAIDSHPAGHDSMRQRGLFGALIVEPPGATWTDPETGRPLLSGVRASVHHPDRPDFREVVLFYHDGPGVVNADGTETVDQYGAPQPIYPLNYRGDPTGARLTEDCPECAEKALFYSSWLHGDPGGGDLVWTTYVNDPIVFRVVGAQVEENHVHHLHLHRWKSEPHDHHANTIDSQTINPGETYEQWLEGGAGYHHGSAGDVLFHCHLFPHYFSGMWGLLRVYDKAQPDLLPLPDRQAFPAPTADEPGYPHFIPGQEGQRPPHPADYELRPPTEVEQRSLKAMKPGAPYVDPCPTMAPMRRYSIDAIQMRIQYNESGDHDPRGRLYVLKEHAAAVLSGAQRPEPLVLRANQGDCIDITFENHLPPDDKPNEMSIHIHYVAFDLLGSDGTAVGYNYDEGIKPGERIYYRWYADEQGPVYFHDHQSGSVQHGTFGALFVEPPGSEWFDPYTGMPITTGTKAIIADPNGPDFREFALFYQDWVPLHDKDGNPINPPEYPHSLVDQGTMAINFTNAPAWHRNTADPAYQFSSWVHGDPWTPILEAYPGDPIKVRLIQGSMEEQHNFHMHGVRWKREPGDAKSGDTAAQTIGTSEYFTFDLQANPAGVLERDYLYGSMALDDIWNGMWGFFRVWGGRVSHLQPLPDRGAPGTGISNADLAKLTKSGTPPPKAMAPGNPCPPGAPLRSYGIVAFQQTILYNQHGDHDPHGIIFALSEDEQAIRSGAKPVEPLVLRANAGDCINVTLQNKLPEVMEHHTDHAKVPVEHPWPNSNRISLHAQAVQYDVQGSDGATIGYNFDQTVAPEGVITYTWYADKELGTNVFWDLADVRSHRHHGAFGLLIIEPAGAEYRDPITGLPLKSGAVADIIVPDGESFREFALAFTDGMYAVNPNGTCIVPAGDEDEPGTPCNQLGGAPEKQGYKGVNYRAEPFIRRFANDPNTHLVFSSYVHGEPATPILRTYLGDPVRLRMAQTADRSYGSSIHVSGHLWHDQWSDPTTHVEGVRGSLTPGDTADLIPLGGAGGLREQTGDFLYQEMKLVRYLEAGLWGIFRVGNTPLDDLQPLPDRRPEPPTGLAVSVPPAQWGTIDLTWDAVPDSDLVGYQVYRSLVNGGPYQRVNPTLLAGTSFRETGLQDATTYHYVVTAVNRYGNESKHSAQATGTTPSPIKVCLYDICTGLVGVTVTESEGSTAVAEGGNSDTYSIVLSKPPLSDVTVHLNPGEQLTLDTSTLRFTPLNWNIAQSVTVTAIDDEAMEGAHRAVVSHTLSSLDLTFSGMAFGVGVSITDNDHAEIALTGSPAAAGEGGAVGAYTVVLKSQPLSDVNISVSPNAQVTVDQSTLIFTPQNWNLPQTVTVSAVDDSVAEGAHTGLVVHRAYSTDPAYERLTPPAMTVSITDNDNAAVDLSGAPSATEGGATGEYTVVLRSQPRADVTVGITPDSQVQVDRSALIFTPENWNVPQSVTVSAVDDSAVEGAHTGAVTHGVSSTDPVYSGMAAVPVAVTITDNDHTAGVIVSGAPSVAEGGATGEYTVVLESQPQGEVTIAVTPDAQVQADKSRLTFTAENWNVPQTVAVSAVNDSLVESAHTGQIAHTVSSTDPAYSGITVPSMAIQIADNDRDFVTGSGFLELTRGKAHFGLAAGWKTDQDDLRVDLEYQYKAEGIQFKARTITAYTASGNSRTFTGTGELNGESVTYTVTVTDNGQPGKGNDHFQLELSNGYSVSGTLGGGNVKIYVPGKEQ